METNVRWRVAVAAVSACALSACGAQTSSAQRASGSTSGAVTAPTTTEAPPLPRILLPVKKNQTVEGLVDVHGHDIYARCSGTGAPTVVYFTGWAPDPSKLGVDIAKGIEAVDGGRHRICSYERRNTGRSEAVAGTQTPDDVVTDVDGVLAAMGESGPFVLLGASFGGLVAGAYAVAHPDRVAGVLLLDSSIPDDYLIDKRHGFEEVCLKSNRHADAWDSLEKLDNCRLAKWAFDRRAKEPSVPLIYLAVQRSLRPWGGRRRPPPEGLRPNLVARSLEVGQRTALDGRSRPEPRREEPGSRHRAGELNVTSGARTRWAHALMTQAERPHPPPPVRLGVRACRCPVLPRADERSGHRSKPRPERARAVACSTDWSKGGCEWLSGSSSAWWWVAS